VRGGESETLEFKRTTGQRREAARTICAMLNHHGGRVIFGVEPDGRMIGQMVSDRTVEEVAQELGEIEPPVFPGIERVDFADGRQLLVVTAQPGSGQPYSCRGQAYRRVGTTSRQLSREEYNRILLERLHGDQRWENQPATGWTTSHPPIVCKDSRRTQIAIAAFAS
jgi:ATP-dependent DNA helicase RecG